MHLCYVDESGTPDLPGDTSHYVLAGVAIPVEMWKRCDDEISKIKQKYLLQSDEIHTAFLLRQYKDQSKIPDFEKLSHADRRKAVTTFRGQHIASIEGKVELKKLKQVKKTYAQTKPFIHLTHSERKSFVFDVAYCISHWDFMKLFGECIDKRIFQQRAPNRKTDEQALEQVVTRYELFLSKLVGKDKFGLLIHDNNPTSAPRHTELMKNFHKSGTLWTSIKNIVETPFFVDSQLTTMIQVADLCAYALRRYLENGEKDLFGIIHPLTHQNEGRFVGLRHYSEQKYPKCTCTICEFHQ